MTHSSHYMNDLFDLSERMTIELASRLSTKVRKFSRDFAVSICEDCQDVRIVKVVSARLATNDTTMNVEKCIVFFSDENEVSFIYDYSFLDASTATVSANSLEELLTDIDEYTL